MGFLKNLIFVDEPAVTPEVQKTVEPAKDAQSDQRKKEGYVFSPNPVANTNTTNVTTSGVPDEKFVAMLENVIAENNIPGLDYFEFKQAVEKMKNLPMDEATKFLSTYSIFEVQGATKEALLLSIDKYISLIKKEEDTFNTEMSASFKENVEDKKLEVENAQKQIAELNNKIVELNTFIMKTTQEAQQEEMKLRMADANFKQSALKVVTVLNSDKEKITNYIK